jgi:SAM-dependent methyltransferase
LTFPAGHGSIAHRLKRLGFEVSACDLYPELFELKDVDIRKGDLDSRLPYDDGSFDHVVCVEGLEHIENPANAIREFSRLMKPGGTIVVSVPNIMNIEERLKWLFTGLHVPLQAAIGRDPGTDPRGVCWDRRSGASCQPDRLFGTKISSRVERVRGRARISRSEEKERGAFYPTRVAHTRDGEGFIC